MPPTSPPSSLEPRIDALYQLPLDEFTAARNALAKDAGPDGREIKTLQKPPLAAWAVNQVYWRHRPAYEALVEAATTLQAAHKAVLSGKGADLRAAGKEHEDAIARALDAALAVLREAGHPATEVTKGAIQTTLRALPAGDPPGRLARVLQPGGFEMLSGIPMRGQAPSRTAPARGGKPAASKAGRRADRDDGAVAGAREAVTAAARDLKIAEQAARREEFEAARAAREADKAASALESAREELEAAQRGVDEAAREARAAGTRRETARKRADAADEALSAARARLADAEKALAALARKS